MDLVTPPFKGNKPRQQVALVELFGSGIITVLVGENEPSETMCKASTHYGGAVLFLRAIANMKPAANPSAFHNHSELQLYKIPQICVAPLLSNPFSPKRFDQAAQKSYVSLKTTIKHMKTFYTSQHCPGGLLYTIN